MARLRWCILVILALGRQRQADLCEFKDNFVYRVSSRTDRATQRNPVLTTTTKVSYSSDNCYRNTKSK